MNVTDQLKEIVDGVARSGALTPEAIRQFDDLRKRATELEASLETRTKERDEARTMRDRNASEAKDTGNRLLEMTKRAEVAEATNADAKKAIWVADFEKQRREELRSIVGDVFRNAEVRRSISHSNPVVMPPTYPGGCATTQYVTDTREETETTK